MTAAFFVILSVFIRIREIGMEYQWYFLLPFFVAAIVGVGWFFWQYRNEKRSIKLGITFLAAVLPILFFIAILLLMLNNDWANFILSVGIILVVFGIMLFPFVLFTTLFVSGIQLIRKEGFSVSHMLSLGFGVFYISFLIMWPLLSDIRTNSIYSFFYAYVSFVFLFTLSTFALYTISSFLNLIRNRRKKYRYIIVLGCGLRNGTEVTPLLGGRIQKGIEAYQQNPGSKIVFSGGQGSDEAIAEGAAMKQFALQNGVPEEAIIVEDRSVNTKENLLFSYECIEQDAQGDMGNLLLVTNRYHVFRALLLAKHLGIPCDGRGSRTKLYFTLNAFIREWIAYLVFWKKKYITVLAVSFFVLSAGYLLRWFLHQ